MILEDAVALRVTERVLAAAGRADSGRVRDALEEAAEAHLVAELVMEWSRWTAAAARTRGIDLHGPVAVSRRVDDALGDLRNSLIADDGGRRTGTRWAELTTGELEEAAWPVVYRLHHAMSLVGGLGQFVWMLALHEDAAESDAQTEACPWGAAVLAGLAASEHDHAQWLAGPLLVGYRSPHVLELWLRLAWKFLRFDTAGLRMLDPETGQPTRWIDHRDVQAAATATDADPEVIAGDWIIRLAQAAATDATTMPIPDENLLTDEVKISLNWTLATNLAYHFGKFRETLGPT